MIIIMANVLMNEFVACFMLDVTCCINFLVIQIRQMIFFVIIHKCTLYIDRGSKSIFASCADSPFISMTILCIEEGFVWITIRNFTVQWRRLRDPRSYFLDRMTENTNICTSNVYKHGVPYYSKDSSTLFRLKKMVYLLTLLLLMAGMANCSPQFHQHQIGG